MLCTFLLDQFPGVNVSNLGINVVYLQHGMDSFRVLENTINLVALHMPLAWRVYVELSAYACSKRASISRYRENGPHHDDPSTPFVKCRLEVDVCRQREHINVQSGDSLLEA